MIPLAGLSFTGILSNLQKQNESAQLKRGPGLKTAHNGLCSKCVIAWLTVILAGHLAQQQQQ